MGCDFPNTAYRTEQRGSGGKRLLTFNPKNALNTQSKILLPCGRCMGCRLDRADQWASRMMHEAQGHAFNSFLTLTYDDQNVPQDYSLHPEHCTAFMHRLRRHARYHYKGLTLRFYLAGEYGDLRGRPHYHAAIFGFDLPDKKQFMSNDLGQPLFRSETLTKLWRHGLCSIGNLDYASARYVAAYCTKKIVGDKAAEHYHRVSPIDGNIYNVKPEFSRSSNRPGIGAFWAEEYHNDYSHDGLITTGGSPHPIPRYYKKYLGDKEEAQIRRAATRKKFENITRHRHERSDARRYVRAEVRNARIRSLKRTNSGE